MPARRVTVTVIALSALVACMGSKHGALAPHTGGLGGGAPGNSPVRIVGGSMTFRSNGWKASDATGTTWTTTNSCKLSAVEFEHVWQPAQTSGTPGDFVYGLSSGWSIEFHSTNIDGSADASDIVTVNQDASNNVVIAVKGQGSFSFKTASSSTAPLADAPSWDKSGYSGIRYKSQSCTMGQSTQSPICDMISEIKVTFGTGGTPTTYACPDGECRVDLLTAP